MVRIFHVFILILIAIQICNAQQFEVGVGLTSTLSANLKTKSNPEFYFLDEVNYRYKLHPKSSMSNDRLLGPAAYLAYHISPKFALRYNCSFISLAKKDVIEISNIYTSGTNYPVKYRFNFINQSGLLQFTPKRTREVQPYFSAGMEWRINTFLGDVSARDKSEHLENQDIKGKIIDRQIKSFSNNHFAWIANIGFEYYIFNFNLAYSQSIGSIEKKAYFSYYDKFGIVSLNGAIRLFHQYHKAGKYKKATDNF